MNFREIRDHLFARGRFGMEPGLETIRLILSRLGNPERTFPIIHVAGTNGKGSTAAFLASILTAGRYRTGLFTSPHLISYTERFRVDGRDISEEELVQVGEQVLAVAPETATFFELSTAIAFLYFAGAGVDLAVMEVGMGGRLDATNCVTAPLSVITPVSLDHCRYLGTTVRDIAGEKAGVITGDGPVVSASQHDEAMPAIEDRCRAFGAPLYRYGRDFSSSWQVTGLDYRGIARSINGLKPGIGGTYQHENAACALAAAELLDGCGFPLRTDVLQQGIEAAYWPGRMELFAGPPRVVLDGAHNPAGANALAAELRMLQRKRLILVTGMMADKDRDETLGPLLAGADEVITVAAALAQATPAEVLAAICASQGITSFAAGGVVSGLARAMGIADPEDLIVVAGSLYVVGEARAYLLSRTPEPFAG